jgi:ribulose-bisphosphate carboxylase large chain
MQVKEAEVPESVVKVVYRVRGLGGDIAAFAKNIALEQTVEVPEHIITSEWIREEIIGKVADIQPDSCVPDAHRVEIHYNAALAAEQLPALINLLYGNVSILGNITVMRADFPPEILSLFPGPRHGTEGIRAMTGVYGRPLLATALKPRGLSNEGFAKLAADFARGGGDIVKDDHNLAEPSVAAFRERITVCQRAVDEANAATGRNCLFLPNLLAPAQDIERHAEAAVKAGVPGVLVCPLLVGLDQLRHLAATYPLVFMAHPSFSGSFYGDRQQGFAPDFMLGTLFRLLGCDSSVFPNYGGRFALTEQECLEIQARLSEPLGGMKPALAAPAGGMSLERIPSMAATYGENAIFLIGGALLSHGPDLAESTRLYLEAVRTGFEERLETPARGFSACEMPVAGVLRKQRHIPGSEDYSWAGRPASNYKADQSFPFEGVTRVELIGKAGEEAQFDLRYFELAPGGYTSLEKHAHTHTIIGVRGVGAAWIDGEDLQVRPNDVVYIDTLEPHQLKNAGAEPFGFYCIVDHDRDRPQAV